MRRSPRAGRATLTSARPGPHAVPSDSSPQPSTTSRVRGVTMSSLAPFSGLDVTCAKCRQTVETTRYCAPSQGCTLTEAGEHLHRICRCGYGWSERCADAPSGQVDRAYPFEAGDDTPSGDTTRQFA